MSTIYNINETNPLEVFSNHYGISEYKIWEATYDFEESDIQNVANVFVNPKKSWIVTSDDCDEYTVFEMPTTEFMIKWSKKVWAKFRTDLYTTVCPHCGEKMAMSVAGDSKSGRRVEQFACDGCGYSWIGYPSGKFIREGVLKSSWELWR